MGAKILFICLVGACATPAQVHDDAVPPPPPGIAAPSDVATPPADAERRPSGLVTKVLKAGTGEEHPWSKDKVLVHYTGWTSTGRMFDSSVQRGKPARFGVDQVIAGWSEGVQMMVVGEIRRMWIPEAIAYKGEAGGPAGMLVFDVELLEIR